MRNNSLYESAAATVVTMGPIPTKDGNFSANPDRFAIRVAGDAQSVRHTQTILAWLTGKRSRGSNVHQAEAIKFFSAMQAAPTTGHAWVTWPESAPATLISTEFIKTGPMFKNAFADRLRRELAGARVRLFKLDHQVVEEPCEGSGYATMCIDLVTDGITSLSGRAWPTFTPTNVVMMIEPRAIIPRGKSGGDLAGELFSSEHLLYIDDRLVSPRVVRHCPLHGKAAEHEVQECRRPVTPTPTVKVLASSSNYKGNESPAAAMSRSSRRRVAKQRRRGEFVLKIRSDYTKRPGETNHYCLERAEASIKRRAERMLNMQTLTADVEGMLRQVTVTDPE